MEHTSAIVVALPPETPSMAYVETQSTGGCGKCHTKGGCGGVSLTRLFCSHKPQRFLVKNPIGAQVGDAVRLGANEQALLHAAWVSYGVPVVCLIVGAYAGGYWAGGDSTRQDIYAAIGGACGLAISFAWIKWGMRLLGGDAHYQAVILEKINSTVINIQKV